MFIALKNLLWTGFELFTLINKAMDYLINSFNNISMIHNNKDYITRRWKITIVICK